MDSDNNTAIVAQDDAPSSAKFTIVWEPENDKRRGPQAFFWTINRNAPKGRRGKGEQLPLDANNPRGNLEMDKLVLQAGVSFVESDRWLACAEFNEKEVERLKKKQALAVYEPDVPNPVGATTDYSDVTVCEDIVTRMRDVSWIQLSIAKEQRAVVLQVLRERLRELQEEKAQRAQQSMSLL